MIVVRPFNASIGSVEVRLASDLVIELVPPEPETVRMEAGPAPMPEPAPASIILTNLPVLLDFSLDLVRFLRPFLEYHQGVIFRVNSPFGPMALIARDVSAAGCVIENLDTGEKWVLGPPQPSIPSTLEQEILPIIPFIVRLLDNNSYVVVSCHAEYWAKHGNAVGLLTKKGNVAGYLAALLRDGKLEPGTYAYELNAENWEVVAAVSDGYVTYGDGRREHTVEFFLPGSEIRPKRTMEPPK